MKIIDVPQTGKIGLQVAFQSRYGLCRRQWTVPTNPNTLAQQTIRSNLAAQAQAYDALTEAQQNAWIAAAALEQTKGSLGQSGPMTGLQLFTKINCSLLAIGGDVVTAPPAKPTIAILPISSLDITNTAGTIALNLDTTSSPPDGTMLWGAPPVASGVRRTPGVVFLGVLGSPVSNKINITTAYTARFGVPAVGQRVFVQCNANIDGWEGQRYSFSKLVPASA